MGESDRRSRLSIVVGDDGTRVDADTGEVLGKAPPSSGEGRTIEEMAQDESLWTFPLVQGSQTKLTLNVGGRRVTNAVLKVKVPELLVNGQFAEGDRLKLEVVLEVSDVDFKLVRSEGRVVGKKRVHTADAVGWRQVELAEGDEDD